jgi:Transposase DDE domain
MTNQKEAKKAKAKDKGIRHTRAIALDRAKHQPAPPPPQQIEQALNDVIDPLTFGLINVYQNMGLRARTLTLPVMLAFVLSLIWRQIGSVREAVRVLNEEGMLWQPPLKITQQAVNTRLRQLPSALFAQVLDEVLPQMHQRWRARQRPLPRPLQTTLQHFPRVVAVDGSSLDALIKRVGLLGEVAKTKSEAGERGAELAGKMLAIIDVGSRLPCKIWYKEESLAHDQSFWDELETYLKAQDLVLFDLGFVNYERYAQLSEQHKYFVTRAKTNMGYSVLKDLGTHSGNGIREKLIQLGSFEKGDGQLLRLVELEHGGKWYSYLTNVLEPGRLSGVEIGWLYRQRWRIEDAFKYVKRLLGLAYFHTSSINGIMVQLWSTWLLYSVLIDLVDDVASELKVPVESISVEMVYRGLYHYSEALKRGENLSIGEYYARRAKILSIIKAPRKKQLQA